MDSAEVHLNLNVRGLAQSATLAINERCAALRQEGRKVYRLGLGQSPFPVPQPVVEALKLNARQKDYLPVKGLPELRAAVARKHRLVVLSDEIYGELHHFGQHVSISRYYPEGSIIGGGLSKWCGAGGWRLGTFVFPRALRWLLESMTIVASETYTSTSAPIQYAAVRAFQLGTTIERYLRLSRKILRSLSHYIVSKLSGYGIDIELPQGGFYLFPDFENFRAALSQRGISSSEELCERLLEEAGVAMLPGSFFGRPPEELTVRFAYVDFDGARALSAAEDLGVDSGETPDEFIETHCFNIVQACNAIGKWLNQDKG